MPRWYRRWRFRRMKLSTWLYELSTQYDHDTFLRMTRYGGCDPAFCAVDTLALEVILQRLEERSRPGARITGDTRPTFHLGD